MTTHASTKPASAPETPSHDQAEPMGENYHAPHTIEDLTRRNIETIHRLERASFTPRTHVDHFVELVTRFCGSMAFVWAHIIWFGGWVVVNELTQSGALHFPFHKAFDPYPFNLLTLAVSLEAIFLSTFILISQNRQSKLDERRNQLDLQINLLTEQENTKVLKMLDAIARKLEVEIEDDPDVQVLEEATRPDQLIRQIERITQTTDSSARKREHGSSRSR